MHVHLPTGDWVCGCVGHYADSIERYFGSSGRRRRRSRSSSRCTSGWTWCGVLLGWDAQRQELDNAEIARDLRAVERAVRRVRVGRSEPRGRARAAGARSRRWGCKGLKLHPTLQEFDPGDDRFLPFFDAAAELGLILLTHAGTSGLGAGEPGGQGLRIDLARPILLDRIAARHPQHADRARARRLAVAPRGRRDGAAQVQRLPRHQRLEVPLPARGGQARDPAPAARAVLLRDRLPDVRPGGVPVRARPARAAAGRRATPSCATTPRSCSGYQIGRSRPP